MKQNLLKCKYTEVIDEEIKPSWSHKMAQKMWICDFLIDKYKKLLYLKKHESFWKGLQ